jgi:peptidylprolyl isomerase
MAQENTNKSKDDNIIVMTLKDGPVHIQLFPEKAPDHVARIKELTKEKFYDGLVFHRVIDGFMAQTGDPTGTGSGKSAKPNLKAEFNDMKHERGVCSMARSSDPNSANSQFFIMLANAPHLDGQYTAWGKVIQGMEFVDKIKKGDARNNGAVSDPDKIISMTLKSDFAAEVEKHTASSGKNSEQQ